jgi:hypothetical protein
MWRDLVKADARAWFGVVWLSTRHNPEARDCQKVLRRIATRRVFWD